MFRGSGFVHVRSQLAPILQTKIEYSGNFVTAMEQLNAAVRIQEKLFDVPHEKLKSLKEKSELCCQMNLPETTAQQIQVKIQECTEQMTQAREFSNIRLERIMDFANNNNVAP
ncbi:hypothetical protein ACROYT_G032680 [Oculina patagonica]